MASDQPTLAAALAELQTSLPAVHKTSEAQYGKYADLAVVSAALLPVMGKLGLSFSAKPTMRDGEFGLAYTLRLAGSDETDEGFYPLSMVIEKGPQAIGSAITYARRYCLCAVTGVAPDSDDDDAQAAQPQAAAAPRRQRGKPPERAPGNLPRNSKGGIARSQATDDELAAAGNMTSGQLAEHTALGGGHDKERKTEKADRERLSRATGADPDDPWLDAAPFGVRTPAAARGVVGVIVQHFGRLGITDRDERLIWTSRLAGRELASSKDMTAEEARNVAEKLAHCRDLSALEAAREATVAAGGGNEQE